MRSRWLFLFGVLVAGCQDKKVDSPAPAPESSVSTAAPAVTPAGETPVAGMIRGKPFTPDKAELQARRFTFRKGKDFIGTFGFGFTLHERDGPIQEGKEWTFAGNKPEHPLIELQSIDDQGVKHSDMIWGTDYSMTLKILKQTPTAIEGTIDLKINNAGNTYLSGKFTAAVRKSPSDPLDASDAPYVQGKVEFVGDWKDENLAAGFVGKGDDGKAYLNVVDARVSPGGGPPATASTTEPQLSVLLNDDRTGPMFKHTRLFPGEYVFYVRSNDVLVGWKKLHVKAGDQQTLDFAIDPSKMGDLAVTLPDEDVNDKDARALSLIPDGLVLPGEVSDDSMFAAGEPKVGEKVLKVKRVPAGKYKVVRGQSTATVEVVAGKETVVTLVRLVEKK